MKKLILLIFAVPGGLYSFGQVDIGLKEGLSINTITEGFSYSYSIGFNAGVLAKIPLKNKMYIQPEILYSVKGEHFPSLGFGGPASTGFHSAGTLNLNYLAVPLLFGYRLVDKISIVAGPEFGFLLNANSYFDNSNHSVTSNFQNFDVGVDLGASYRLYKNFGIELRYYYGFKDLAKVTYTDPNGNPIESTTAGSNRVFQFGIYYIFRK